MSTIAYGMSDLAASPDGRLAAGSVSVPTTAGGCGEQHTVTVDDDGRPYVNCDACAPVLISMPGSGWAATPNGVALTPDEMAERELAERDGTAMQRVIMRSVTDQVVGQMMHKNAPAAAPVQQLSLIDQLTALSDDDWAKVAELRGGHPTPAEPGGGTGISAQSKDQDSETSAEAEQKPSKPAAKAPAKRPGRPPRTA